MTEEDRATQWCFPELLPNNVAFAFLGGPENSQMHVHFPTPSPPRVLVSVGVHLERAEILDMLRDAADQGEAERMIFFFIDSTLSRCLEKRDEGRPVTTSFDIRCDDNDALCGLAALHIYREQLRFQQAEALFRGRILLRVHRKSSKFARHLGQLVQRRDGARVLGTALGEHIICYFDLIALYHFFEKDGRLPNFHSPGHRAISVLSVIYIFTNTDYIFSSVSVAEMMCGLKSDEFYNAAHRLVNLPTDDEYDAVGEVQFLSTGMWRLFRATMINRDSTKKIVAQKYSPETIASCLQSNSDIAWLFVRGSSIMGKERKPAPDELAFLAQLCIAQVTLHRWAVQTYKIRPDQGKTSLENTCYDVPSNPSDEWEVKWYPDLDGGLRNQFRRFGASAANISILLDRQYSNIQRGLDPLLRTALMLLHDLPSHRIPQAS